MRPGPPGARLGGDTSAEPSWRAGDVGRVDGIGGYVVRAAHPEGNRIELWQPG
jgi:hypothetical protein